MYSPTVQRLLAGLAHRGRLQSPTGAAERENPVCGDRLRLELEITDEVIVRVGYLVEGCTAAVVSAEAVAEWAEGRSIRDARELRVEELLQYVGGLPSHKSHGAVLAVDALHGALRTRDEKT